MYLCGLKKNRKKGSNTNCYIENCVWLLAENGHNRNAAGKQILTQIGNLDGVKAIIESLDSFSIDLDSFSNGTVIRQLLAANSTLVQKGSKDAHVSSRGREKDYITMMLGVVRSA